MRLSSNLAILAWAGSVVAQNLPQPGWHSPDPVTAVLTLTPKSGDTQQLENYIKHSQNVTTTECPTNTQFLWFKVAGKDQFVVIEQYTNQSAMFNWVRGPQHNQLLQGFLPLADILKSGVASDMKLF